MEQINGALLALLKAIKECDEYKNYQRMKEQIHEKPELEKAIHEFRKRNYQVQNSKNADLFDEIDRLEREKIKLCENPLAAEYLAAELAFCRIIQHSNWSLIEDLDIEVGFENEGK